MVLEGPWVPEICYYYNVSVYLLELLTIEFTTKVFNVLIEYASLGNNKFNANKTINSHNGN